MGGVSSSGGVGRAARASGAGSNVCACFIRGVRRSKGLRNVRPLVLGSSRGCVGETKARHGVPALGGVGLGGTRATRRRRAQASQCAGGPAARPRRPRAQAVCGWRGVGRRALCGASKPRAGGPPRLPLRVRAARQEAGRGDYLLRLTPSWEVLEHDTAERCLGTQVKREPVVGGALGYPLGPHVSVQDIGAVQTLSPRTGGHACTRTYARRTVDPRTGGPRSRGHELALFFLELAVRHAALAEHLHATRHRHRAAGWGITRRGWPRRRGERGITAARWNDSTTAPERHKRRPPRRGTAWPLTQ